MPTTSTLLCCSQSLLYEAMSCADHILFNRDNPVELASFGQAYRHVMRGHRAAEQLSGLENYKEIVQEFQKPRVVGCKDHLNPAEIHAKITAEANCHDRRVTTTNRDYDLADKADAQELQRLFELATGTVERIECQLVITMFHCLKGSATVVATTFNRGDCLAFATGSHIHRSVSMSVSMSVNMSVNMSVTMSAHCL